MRAPAPLTLPSVPSHPLLPCVAPASLTPSVALCGRPCPSGTDQSVAALLRRVVNERLGYDLLEIGNAMVSDRAAGGVAAAAGIEEKEICMMHDGDKLGASAIGDLVRTKNKVTVNPFNEGKAVLQNATKCATHFSYGPARLQKLHKFCDLTGEAKIRPAVIKCATRIAAQWRLIYSLLRMPRALAMYAHAYANEETVALGWTAPTKLEAEIEAVLYATQKTSLLAQCERFLNGAFRAVIINLTLNALREHRGQLLQMVDLSKPTTAARLPRKPTALKDMSDVGKVCAERALLEGERRFCANKTEEINGANIDMSRREMVATMLDVRTTKGPHINTAQLGECKDAFTNEYANFCVKAKERRETLLAQEQEKKVKRAAEGSAAGPPSKRRSNSSTVDASVSGITYSNGYGDVSSEDSDEPEPEAEPDKQAQFDLYKQEGKRFLKAWRKLDIDWRAEYPEYEFQSKKAIDIMELMPLDIGARYRARTLSLC